MLYSDKNYVDKFPNIGYTWMMWKRQLALQSMIKKVENKNYISILMFSRALIYKSHFYMHFVFWVFVKCILIKL